MFSDTNLVILMGNLIEAPVLYYIGELETPFCKVRLVSNYRSKGFSEVTYQNVVAYGNTALLLAREGKKGKKIQVVGRLRSKEQNDPDNEIIIKDLKLLGQCQENHEVPQHLEEQ